MKYVLLMIVSLALVIIQFLHTITLVAQLLKKHPKLEKLITVGFVFVEGVFLIFLIVVFYFCFVYGFQSIGIPH